MIDAYCGAEKLVLSVKQIPQSTCIGTLYQINGGRISEELRDEVLSKHCLRRKFGADLQKPLLIYFKRMDQGRQFLNTIDNKVTERMYNA